jgi:hypothetical protein|nr:hypothetical protein [Kofleriaceae bacterium]
MTSIGGAGGPGGIGGPGGPKGPGGVDGTDEVGDFAEVGEAGPADEASAATGADHAASVSPSQLDALASDLASGKLTPHEAIDRLVASAGAGLPHAEQAELRSLITDLVANDPYLSGLVGRL